MIWIETNGALSFEALLYYFFEWKTPLAMNASIRVGFVGMGKVGRIRLQEIGKFDKVQAVGYVDPDPTVSVANIPRFLKVEQLVAEAHPDAVFVSVPNRFTAALTEYLLRRGISVFAEKPPGRSVQELTKLRSLVDSADAPTLMYGFNHRYKAGVKALLDVVDLGRLGDVMWLRGRYGKEIDEAFYGNWRSDYFQSGGGILLDQGIHMVDLMRIISGGFDSASSAISNHVTGIDGIEDNAFVIFRSNRTGVTASLHSTMTQWRYLFSLEVFCQGGSLILNGLRTPSASYGSEVLNVHMRTAEGARETTEAIFDSVTDEPSWLTEIEIFLGSMRNHQQPPSGNFEDAIQTLALIEMAYAGDPSFHRPTL